MKIMKHIILINDNKFNDILNDKKTKKPKKILYQMIQETL